MEVLITHSSVAEEDGGESLLQLLDSVRSNLFPRGVGIAYPADGDPPSSRPHRFYYNPADTTASSSSSGSASPSCCSRPTFVAAEAGPAGAEASNYNLKSPFWEEARAAIEHTEKNTMGLLLNFLERQEEGRLLDEDRFVSSLLADLPACAAATGEEMMPPGICGKRRSVQSEQQHEWGTLFAALDLDLEFTEEELLVFEEEEEAGEEVEAEEEEPLGSPRKKRRNDTVDGEKEKNEEDEGRGRVVGEDCESPFGEVQSYEEQVFLQLFEF